MQVRDVDLETFASESDADAESEELAIDLEENNPVAEAEALINDYDDARTQPDNEGEHVFRRHGVS